MKKVILQRILENGELLKAAFIPEQGMNLASLCFGDQELIDQSTKPLFDDHFGGLGPLIGPHFYHRKTPPFVPDETIFPHIARVKAAGSKEPFSHGIGRYVAWNWTASDLSIQATLSGVDTHAGITLAALEGFDFKMRFKAHLTGKGIEIDMDVESDSSPCIAGLHYYYALENRSGRVEMSVKHRYVDKLSSWSNIPARWLDEKNHRLKFDLNEDCDYGFPPDRMDFSGDAELITGGRNIKIYYQTKSNENAFVLWHPKGASFVCIEPVTARNPRELNQRKNHLKVRITSS